MEKKFAIFDIDGTISLGGVIPDQVIEGLQHVQECGYLTTVSTGRGYIRTKETLGKNFDTVVTKNSLIILEHGSKIATSDGEVVQADYFRPNELDHVIDFCKVNLEMIRLIWFMSPDPEQPVQIWCKLESDIEKERPKRGGYGELFYCSIEELRSRLGEFPLSNVSAKLESFVAVENLKLHFTKSEIDILFQDSMMEFVRNISDKAKAVKYIEEYFQVPVEGMLIAGNAINDVDMLNLPAGKRILVGSGTVSDLVFARLVRPEEVIRVASPEALGIYLKNLEG